MHLPKILRYSVLVLFVCFIASIKTLACPTPITNNSISLPFENVFCDSGTPDSIKGSLPQGGTGVYSIKWLQSTDVQNFTIINGVSTQSLYTGLLLQTTYYRRVVLSGDCSDTSNIVSVTVNGGSYIFLFAGPAIPQSPYRLHKINMANNQRLESISTPDSINNMVISRKRNRLYFAPAAVNSTWVYVAETFPVLKITDSIPVPAADLLLITPDESKLLVSDYRNSSISFISLDSNKVISSFDCGSFITPAGFSTDGSKLYLYSSMYEVRDTIRVINTADNSVIATTPFLGYLINPTVSPDGSKIYALNPYQASFRIMNVSDYSVQDMTFDSNISYIDLFRLSADGSKIYVMCTYNNSKALMEINTSTAAYRHIAFYGGGSYSNLEISADETKLLITSGGGNLAEIDIASGAQTNLISPNLWWDVGRYATKGPLCTSCIYNYWIGSIDSDWENPGNWSCNSVPGPTTYVVINSGNVVLNSNASIHSLMAGPGANLTVNSGFHLTILH